MGKLIEALQEIIEVASGERQVAEDDTEGMAWIDKRARAAVRAHDAGTDGGLPTDHRPCPNCGRSDGWHYALGHPPLPVGDCRKIVWMRDKDEMEWWGVRAYNHAEGYWQSNSREESSTVLFWMETPHSPHYPPAYHAAESAPVAQPMEEALTSSAEELGYLCQQPAAESAPVSTAQVGPPDKDGRRCTSDWITTDKEGEHHVVEYRRSFSTAQLHAEDQHRAAEPVEDVPPGYVKLEDVEKVIRELESKYDVSRWTTDYFITELRARLAPKPSPDPIEEVIAMAICNECGARVGKRELHLKWHAKTGGAK